MNITDFYMKLKRNELINMLERKDREIDKLKRMTFDDYLRELIEEVINQRELFGGKTE